MEKRPVRCRIDVVNPKSRLVFLLVLVIQLNFYDATECFASADVMVQMDIHTAAGITSCLLCPLLVD
jgi:hypothetical protein